MSSDIALKKLIDGKRRYVDIFQDDTEMLTKLELGNPADSQNPFAIILGCSDSRVPAKLVFNSNLGDFLWFVSQAMSLRHLK